MLLTILPTGDALGAEAGREGRERAVRSATASGVNWRGVGDSLRRPRLVNPISIRLSRGNQQLSLNDHRDYILRMPRAKKVGFLIIWGGRNIRMVGGYMSVKTPGPNLAIKDKPGTRVGRVVHIEGLLIDSSSGVPSDGITISAPKTIVQLKRVRIVGLQGSGAGLHADVIQPWGGVKALLIDGLSASSHYNNLYLRRENDPLGPRIGRVRIYHADIRGFRNSGVPDATLRGISIGTQALSGTDDWSAVNCKVTSRITLRHFHAIPPKGRSFGQFVYPHDRMSGSARWCRARVANGGRTLDWPRLRVSAGGKVSGVVRRNEPRRGTFVPHRWVGIGYRA
jgi:hypothetical protein